jgi:hypothetical protein
MRSGWTISTDSTYPKKNGSRKARYDRKGNTTSYQAQAYHPVGLGLYLFIYLNFFACLAPLREKMTFCLLSDQIIKQRVS